jgi:hypothetical protein
MAFEPVKFVDSLTKGIVDAVYDFTRLSAATLAIPFVRRRPRFWLGVVSIAKRLTPLAFLLLWVLIAVSVAFDNLAKLVASAAGIEKSSDITTVAVVCTALAIAMACDLAVRAAYLPVRSRVRRRLYEDLTRLALAPLFIGAFAVVLINARSLWPFFSIIGFWYGIIYPRPWMFVFAIALVVIAVKALRLHGLTRAAGAVAALVLLPTMLANVAFWSAILVQRGKAWLSPAPYLISRGVDCAPAPDGFRLTGFIGIVGKTNYPINPSALGVRYKFEPNQTFKGEFKDGLPGLVLASDKYLWVDLPARYDGKDTARAKPSAALGEGMTCWLIFGGNPEGGTDAKIPSSDTESSGEEKPE